MTATLPARSYYDHPCGFQARHLAVCLDWADGTAVCYLWRRGRKPGEPLLSDLSKALDTLRFFDDDPGVPARAVDASAGRPAARFMAWVESPAAEAFYAGADDGPIARACDRIIWMLLRQLRDGARRALSALVDDVRAGRVIEDVPGAPSPP